VATGEHRPLEPDTASGASDLELLIFSGDDVRTFPLPRVGTVTIGRGEQNALRIDDPSVSRNHAVLHAEGQLRIEDLGSANGTLVRGKAGGSSAASETLNVRHLLKREASLAVGDSVLFGTTSVVLRHKPVVAALDLTAGQPGVIVRDSAMRVIYEQAALAARSPLSVLLLGETGAGKEVLARAIHAHSRRAAGPFLGVNCAALTESLQESELFGYEKGAFTGALQPRAGIFEAANGGTVFLDEVGELAQSTQAKLLRVLEDRTVTRLGTTRGRTVDVRFVAATNRDLEAESAAGRFRQDLFFRLNTISLLIPPLRERPGEIEPLARMFLAATCKEIERAPEPALSAAALDILRRHRWPGNVRELRNAVGRAAVMCLGDVVEPEHLPPSVLKAVEAGPGPGRGPAPAGTGTTEPPAAGGLRKEIDALEKARILDALDRAGGNQTRAARALGISRGTLIARLDEFGITRPRKRDDSDDE
jgi:DNA-binding NtrC family response regulator